MIFSDFVVHKPSSAHPALLGIIVLLPFLGLGNDSPHLLLGDDLGVRPEPGAAVQVVRQVCTRVCGDITFSGHAQEVHCAECVHYLLGREVLPATVHLLFQVLVYQQSQEACQEVCLDEALGFDKKRPWKVFR